jgi:hypothetical protein
MPRKRPALFEVRYSEKPNRDNHWRIVGFVNGKRTQYWYKTEEDAEAAAADKNAEITAYGTQIALSSVDRVRAFNAADRLAPFGKTIDDAVNFYLEYLNRVSSTVPFELLAKQIREDFARRRKRNQTSDKHVESLEYVLKKLESRFTGELVSEITTKQIRDWLNVLPFETRTLNNIRNYSRQVFSLAIDYEVTRRRRSLLADRPLKRELKCRRRRPLAPGQSESTHRSRTLSCSK